MKPTTFRTLTAALLAVAALFALSSTAQASNSQLSVFQDDGHLLSYDTAQRQAVLDKIQSLGADVVKISVLWRASSPNFMSHSRPGGDTKSPDYYNWGIAPTTISEIQARGMIPWVMVTEVGPDWAEASGASNAQPGGLKPDPDLFGDFAVAAFKRFGDVPFFQVGNEPNFKLWLWPQVIKGNVSYSAVQYRKMYLAAQERILAVGLGNRQLLFGALAPRAEKVRPGQNTAPLRFLRDFFCLNDKLKPLKGRAAKLRECTGRFKPVQATGFAYHPYTDSFGPRKKAEQPDDAHIAYMSRIYKLLDRASSLRRLSVSRIPVWNDEFAYESDPPDPRRAPIRKIPAYLNESEYLSYKDPRLKSYAQYQLYDEPLPENNPAAPYAGFQSGLYFADGTAKGGVLTAYRMPMVAIKTKNPNRASVWFGVRNLRNLSARTAYVQFRPRSSRKWKTVANVVRFKSGRYAQVNVSARGAAKGQFRVLCDDYSSRTTAPVKAPKTGR